MKGPDGPLAAALAPIDSALFLDLFRFADIAFLLDHSSAIGAAVATRLRFGLGLSLATAHRIGMIPGLKFPTQPDRGGIRSSGSEQGQETATATTSSIPRLTLRAYGAHRGVPGSTLCLRCPPGCTALSAQCPTGHPPRTTAPVRLSKPRDRPPACHRRGRSPSPSPPRDRADGATLGRLRTGGGSEGRRSGTPRRRLAPLP